MAQRIEIQDITIAAGVPKTTPVTTILPWREGFPERVEFRFPPGPSGLVGLQLLHSGRVIIPKRASTFLVTDDEIVAWPLDGYPYNAVYAVRAYNEGAYSHTIQLRMLLNEIGTAALVPRGPIVVAPPWESAGIQQEGAEVG